MPPMACLLPMSVAPSPPVVSPPRCFAGSMSDDALAHPRGLNRRHDAARRAAVDDDVERLPPRAADGLENHDDSDEHDEIRKYVQSCICFAFVVPVVSSWLCIPAPRSQ